MEDPLAALCAYCEDYVLSKRFGKQCVAFPLPEEGAWEHLRAAAAGARLSGLAVVWMSAGDVRSFAWRRVAGQQLRQQPVRPLLHSLLDETLRGSPFYPRLRAEQELTRLSVRVVLLTGLRAVKDMTDWQVGVHGVHMQWDGSPLGDQAQSMYLPDVIEARGWGKQGALQAALVRAGCPRAKCEGELASGSCFVSSFEVREHTMSFSEYYELCKAQVLKTKAAPSQSPAAQQAQQRKAYLKPFLQMQKKASSAAVSSTGRGGKGKAGSGGSSFAKYLTLVIVLLAVAMGCLRLLEHSYDVDYEEFQRNYEVLGVSPGASLPQIRKAYRKLTRKWHPDKNPGCVECEDTFRRITEAYSQLSDFSKGVLKVVNKPTRFDQQQARYRE